MEARMAMIAMTTKSSIRVNPPAEMVAAVRFEPNRAWISLGFIGVFTVIPVHGGRLNDLLYRTRPGLEALFSADSETGAAAVCAWPRPVRRRAPGAEMTRR